MGGEEDVEGVEEEAGVFGVYNWASLRRIPLQGQMRPVKQPVWNQRPMDVAWWLLLICVIGLWKIRKIAIRNKNDIYNTPVVHFQNQI